MKFSDTLKIVSRNLRRRKGRTVLTAIGVTIGTASIVAMMSLAIGLKDNVVRTVSQFGSLTEVNVYPMWNRDNPKTVQKLDAKAVALIKQIDGVTAVMPTSRYTGETELEIGKRMGSFEVVGVDDTIASKFDYKMAFGRYLTGGRNEIVITYKLPDNTTEKQKAGRKKKTFNPVAPPNAVPGGSKAKEAALRTGLINKSATLAFIKSKSDGTKERREYKVKIVGVLDKSYNAWSGGTIYVPMAIVENMNKWNKTDEESSRNKDSELVYQNLVVKVPDTVKVQQVVDYIKALGFQASSPITELQEVNKVFLVIQVVLGGIGAVSLLVATIGIINTMVMSILERTREIGIMKVLGATIPNIRNLFLFEAGTIGFIGGTIGLLISYGIAGIANLIYRSNNVLGLPEETVGDIAIIPMWLAVFALVFSSVVGLLAGIYPALRAARLSPLNAIRQE